MIVVNESRAACEFIQALHVLAAIEVMFRESGSPGSAMM
jgi:hypothetical protein